MFYDKIHMFNVKLSSQEMYGESKIFYAGKKIKIADCPWVKLE